MAPRVSVSGNLTLLSLKSRILYPVLSENQALASLSLSIPTFTPGVGSEGGVQGRQRFVIKKIKVVKCYCLSLL